ncbi:MAG: hypothetical protein VZR06_18550 [Butyrivibrio sp.]|nr:hypothetical protein [Butyrivibrio sp.]
MTTVITVGLIGALLMFCGDMTLYFDKDDYVQDGTINPITVTVLILDFLEQMSIETV